MADSKSLIRLLILIWIYTFNICHFVRNFNIGSFRTFTIFTVFFLKFESFFCLVMFQKSADRVVNRADSNWFDMTLALCRLSNFACFCCLWSFFVFFFFFLFLINFFKKDFQEYSQGVKEFGSRSGLTFDILSGLIWVQTICKGYQQMTKVATSRERFNSVDWAIKLKIKKPSMNLAEAQGPVVQS